MRIVFAGASGIAIAAVKILLESGEDVVIIDQDRDKLDRLGDRLDCGLIYGDCTSPEVLRDAAGDDADILVCLTEHDQDNILTALVGRSIGFERVIPQIREPSLASVCQELGLEDTIAPQETMGRHLADSIMTRETVRLTSVIDCGLRLVEIKAGDAARIASLDLPAVSRIVCVYRGEEFLLLDDDDPLRNDDRILIATDQAGSETLKVSD